MDAVIPAVLGALSGQPWYIVAVGLIVVLCILWRGWRAVAADARRGIDTRVDSYMDRLERELTALDARIRDKDQEIEELRGEADRWRRLAAAWCSRAQELLHALYAAIQTVRSARATGTVPDREPPMPDPLPPMEDIET